MLRTGDAEQVDGAKRKPVEPAREDADPQVSVAILVERLELVVAEALRVAGDIPMDGESISFNLTTGPQCDSGARFRRA